MNIIEVAAWATLGYIVVAISFHIYVAVRVTRIGSMFETEDGLQDFSNRVMKSFIFSALTIPAHFYRIITGLKEQAAQQAATVATNAAETLVNEAVKK